MSEERDIIDSLIETLNDGVDGVTFDRDVLDTNRPDDWAAVELTGADNEWADGRIIDQVLTVDVYVCVSERGSRVKRAVHSALETFRDDGHDIGWRLKERAYLYDLNKVMWHWTVDMLEAPPEEPDPDEWDDDPDEDPLPFTDPEEDPDTQPFADPEEDPD